MRLSFQRATTNSMRMSMNGLSADDLVEQSLRIALLGEAPPQGLLRYGMQNSDDPWAALASLRLSEDSVKALARVLLVERLVGSGDASAVEAFELGPLRGGTRQVELSYWEPKVYANRDAELRTVAAERAWG